MSQFFQYVLLWIIGLNLALSDRASLNFASDLYRTTAKFARGNNFVLSPSSVERALALLYIGSQGETARQLADGLYLNGVNINGIVSKYDTLNRMRDLTAQIATKIYAPTGNEFNKNFEQIAFNSFGSELGTVDFNKPVQVAQDINRWVSIRTNNKIRQLFSPNQVTPDVAMILVNAVYFNGSWLNPFDTKRTTENDFWVTENQSVKVNMMFVQDNFKYGLINELNAIGVLLPYKDSKFSMLVMLPATNTTLSAVEDRLNYFDLQTWKQEAHEVWVEVFIPKFSLETSVQLKEILINMGITGIFSDQQDLRRIFNTPTDVKVSNVIQKTYINVNEEGTEAAAATGFKLIKLSIPPRIVVNRPFMFAIISDDEINFIGSVKNPQS